MDDTQMLDWLQRHATEIRLEPVAYRLMWIDNRAIQHETIGCDLRDCVRGAVVGEVVGAERNQIERGREMSKPDEIAAAEPPLECVVRHRAYMEPIDKLVAFVGEITGSCPYDALNWQVKGGCANLCGTSGRGEGSCSRECWKEWALNDELD